MKPATRSLLPKLRRTVRDNFASVVAESSALVSIPAIRTKQTFRRGLRVIAVLVIDMRKSILRGPVPGTPAGGHVQACNALIAAAKQVLLVEDGA